MPQQVLTSTENNFTKGLITEFTGLNFPENAATATDNTTYTLVGDVIRREGIDNEINGVNNVISNTGVAISSYKWNNSGGDAVTQIVVTQVGNTLNFYQSSAATVAAPLSTQKLISTVTLTAFIPFGSTNNPSTLECQYAEGNGYLFVFHPYLEPFYCKNINGVITANIIILKFRDFTGVIESGIPDNQRPPSLTPIHAYNLLNQGWGHYWSATSSNAATIGAPTNFTWTVQANLPLEVGNQILVQEAGATASMTGVVTAYAGTTLSWTSVSFAGSGSFSSWSLSPTDGYISTWAAQIGNLPSNSDVWWNYRNTSNVFSPGTLINTISATSGPASKGHFILPLFNQTRATLAFGSSQVSVPDSVTNIRPKTGTWFQGRVWYTGIDANFSSLITPYTWTEKIYFSQIIQSDNQIGNCFQTNDPTSSQIFDLLPSDGGVISIPGSGSIYKLFPLQNAMIVFAANGVWYITGSSGIGFTATDYTIVKLSSVRSISTTSFVDVQGLPIFWNEEGIYQVEAAKQGTSLLNTPLHVNPLEVVPITLGTILSLYNTIPIQSKKYARGAYDPIEYVVQWVYRDTVETDITSRYTYNKILNYNTANKAFYTHTISTTPRISSIVYVSGPGGLPTPPPQNKYLCCSGNNVFFADEHDSNFVDWASIQSTNYISTFTTGYKLHGQASRRFQVPYIYVYSRLEQPVSYYIQSLWDYPLNADSGRWSTNQLININSPNFGIAFRRHRLRGWGLVLQIKITSVDGQPFDIMGWSLYETANQGV